MCVGGVCVNLWTVITVERFASVFNFVFILLEVSVVLFTVLIIYILFILCSTLVLGNSFSLHTPVAFSIPI